MAQLLGSIQQASLQDAWLTIGTYDGVHIGHQEILRGLAAGARANGAPAVVLTFHPHPAAVIRPQGGPHLLTMPDERAEYLHQAGADVVITQAFDQQVAGTDAEDFLVLLKKHLGFRHLWVGYDFAFGHKRGGDIHRLHELEQQFDYQLQVIPAVHLNGQIVSSSRIRGMLREGQVTHAAQALGRWYKLSGEVVKGDGRGHTLGFPTANLMVPAEKFIPESGVYACIAQLEELHRPAAVNIGIRPTFDGSSAATQIEAHILDFQGNLYGHQVTLYFIDRLRGEKGFPSIQALIEQIRLDIIQTRELVKTSQLVV
jgi:riboflavin kinase/FMN adenylyltransferase